MANHAVQQDAKLNFIDNKLTGQVQATERLNSQVGGLQKSVRAEMQEQFRIQTEAIDQMLAKYRKTE